MVSISQNYQKIFIEKLLILSFILNSNFNYQIETIIKKLILRVEIFIFIIIYKREFLSNLLLSIIAAKNFNVYIGSNNVFNILHKKGLLSPGIFHTKSLSHGTKNKFS